MGRIAERFAALKQRGEAALIPFLMAGDPDLGVTKELVRAAAASGADLIELGVPFSDPTADGPVLQRSAYRALQRGASLPRILELVSDLRPELELPVILFGYYNPFFRYGPEALSRDARKAGVDGLLVVDLPPEECEELWRPARKAGLDLIFLLAPTSDAARVRAVLRRASGFVYYVSMTGVTGSRPIAPTDVRPAVQWVRPQCQLPIGVGFGITSGAEAAAVAAFADAVIVGTSVMRLVEESDGAADVVAKVGTFVRELKSATRLRSHVGAR
jgi:tryptophan synthase alpha chain